MYDDINLNNCPCGGEAHIRITRSKNTLTIKCDDCAINYPQKWMTVPPRRLAEIMAEKWNTVYAPEPPTPDAPADDDAGKDGE